MGADVVKMISESGIRIRKVKWQKGRVTIDYQKAANAGGWSDYSISSHDAPRPQLPVSLQKMADHVLEICELPDKDVDRIVVFGVSISYHMVGEQDQRGLVISATRTLHQSAAPMVINTVLKKEEVDGRKSDVRSVMTAECNADMLEVIAEAIRYVTGERQQTVLDLGSGAPPEKPQEPAGASVPQRGARKKRARDGSVVE